ncbi:MAG TPA: methyl-accepting chemotaxis protein [Bacillota bacterium]|nr:methyl-accepting chemotaxis protein [Bacillota bacterium]
MKIFRLKIKKSLSVKLISMCLLLLAVPSLIIGMVAYQHAKSELSHSGEIRLKNNVRSIIQMIDLMDKQVKKGSISLGEAQEQVRVQMIGEKDGQGKRPINKNIDLGPNGYTFAVDDSGVLLAHPTSEGKNLLGFTDPKGNVVLDTVTHQTMIESLVSHAKEGGGFTFYDYPLPSNPNQLETKISYTEKDPHWGWNIGAGAYLMDFNSGANEVLSVLMITLGISLLLGTIIVYLFSNHITVPLRKLEHQARQIAAGDLTGEPLQIGNKDEIGQLVIDFNRMTSNLKSLIIEVHHSVEQVAASSHQLAVSAETTSRASEQITGSVQEVAVGAERQASHTGEALEAVAEITKGMDQSAASIHSVADLTQRANERAFTGTNVVNQTIEQMHVVRCKVGDTSKIINELGEKSKEINKIVGFITQIASQTNLLALNAAIEAARAGEHGRGFAIVADEVRKLAEQSGQAAGEIDQIIKKIQEESDKAVVSMQDGSASVEEGINMVQQTGASFQEIVLMVQEIMAQSEEVSAIVEEINASCHGMSGMIEGVSHIAEQSSGNMEEVAAAAEEQNAAMQEISASSEMLTKMAQQLQDSIKKFTL